MRFSCVWSVVVAACCRGVLGGDSRAVTVPLQALQFPIIDWSSAGTDNDDTGLEVELGGFIRWIKTWDPRPSLWGVQRVL